MAMSSAYCVTWHVGDWDVVDEKDEEKWAQDASLWCSC